VLRQGVQMPAWFERNRAPEEAAAAEEFADPNDPAAAARGRRAVRRRVHMPFRR
jgi:hypothetical protein